MQCLQTLWRTFLLTSVVVVMAAVWAAEAAAELDEAVWEGHAECTAGRRHYRLSIEPGEKRRQSRLVIDILDAPGGQPWARWTGAVTTEPTRTGPEEATHNVLSGNWHVRAVEEPALPRTLLLRHDGQALAASSFGDCETMSLQRVDPSIVTGGIVESRDLAPRFIGTLSCSNGRPRYLVSLSIEDTADGVVEATLAYRDASRASSTIDGRFAAFGEFDGQTGSLTLIADRWLGPGQRTGHMFDLVVGLRDGGTRLVGLTSDHNCRTLDVIIPGHDPAAGIGPPAASSAIRDWGDASACVALVGWASQALPEAGIDSFYAGITVGKARQIGMGLLDATRFFAAFGTSFEELGDMERAKLAELAEYCVKLAAFESAMRHSGAHLFATEFFRFPKPDVETAAQRLRLLKVRLLREMEQLREQSVTADDIVALERTLAELPERYADLWQADRAAARSLVLDKLDLARGDLAARLEEEIAALPVDPAAFAAARALERRFAALGDDRDRLAQLATSLDDRLASIADALIAELVDHHRASTYDLVALEHFSAAVDELWPVVQAHARSNGAAMRSLSDLAAAAAAAASEAFIAKTDEVMAAADGFAERELAYRTVVALHAKHVPLAAPLSPAFTAFEAQLMALRPVPTIEDLVAGDGSPTSLGMRLALAEHVAEVRATVDMLFPPISLSRFYGGVRVAAVQKHRCKAAPDESYWCDYDLRLDGSFPFLFLAELASYRARFALRRDTWRVVETPPSSASSARTVDQPRGGHFMDMTDPIQYWGANMMMDIR